MKQILYATTNKNKFDKAKINLKQFDIEIIHQSLEMTELQSSDGEVIVRHKAEQAFAHFQQPVLVNDDTWSIFALRGFPSTGMKLCNDFLLAEDWLRLMNGISDRRIDLISHYAYYDGTNMKTIVQKDERRFLTEARGQHLKAPALEVIAKNNSRLSVAEEIAAGIKVETENFDFWEKLAGLLK